MNELTEIQKQIEDELKELDSNKPQGTGEKLPAFKLEEKKIKKIEINFEKDYPFQSYTKEENGIKRVTKIIPVLHNGIRMIWWLNVKNPAYRELLERHKLGQSTFQVTQFGTNKDTKYEFVDNS